MKIGKILCSRASVWRLQEISNQAAAYVVGYTLSFIFSVIYCLIEAYGSGPVPFAVLLLARFFFPLQGLFNVLIYTFSHVVSYWRNHTECNWPWAFWEVVKNGGDSDQSMIGRGSRKRESVRRRERVLAQSKFRSPWQIYSVWQTKRIKIEFNGILIFNRASSHY